MRMTSLIALILLMGLYLFSACSDDGDESMCDQKVIVDSERHMNGPSDHVQITDARIEGDCLLITFGASGCSGDNWNLALFDAAVIAESFPVQRYVRLSLDNHEDCLAFFTREMSFDLEPIQLKEYDTIIINLEDYDQQLQYEY